MQSALDRILDWEGRAQASGFSVSVMARTLGVTVRLLETFFLARFGAGPHQWMVSVRMVQAAILLRKGVPAKVVSSEVGYKQASHFSRQFKRFFGVSPNGYWLPLAAAHIAARRATLRI